MSGKTPGQAACEAFWKAVGAGPQGQPEDAALQWAETRHTLPAWDAAAQAAIAECSLWINRAPDTSLRDNPGVTIMDNAPDAATLIKAAQDYDHAHRQPRNGWKRVPDDQVHRLLAGAGFLVPQPSPGIADVRERLENLAAGMELSATATRPSKKTEIEERWARAVREILAEITPAAADERRAS